MHLQKVKITIFLAFFFFFFFFSFLYKYDPDPGKRTIALTNNEDDESPDEHVKHII